MINIRLFPRRILKIKSFFYCILFLILIYNELLSFYIKRYTWPENSCGDVKEFYRVLFIADPQILGENSETWIARWDADRYLQRTFYLAYSFVKPDLVVFLGDLMDEGSIATDEQNLRYLKRFKNIFFADTLLFNKSIFIPGDNDIGGENEDVTQDKVKRFDHNFGLQPDVYNFNNLRFVKVNLMSKFYPTLPVYNIKNETVTIVLSHIPLLGGNSMLATEAMMKLKPELIISAHDHRSVHFVGDVRTGERSHVEVLTEEINKIPSWRFQLKTRFVNEILVPTCSYRMGVQDMAYGVGFFDKKGKTLCYNLLWLPRRLFQLKLYLFVFPIVILFILIKSCRRANTDVAYKLIEKL